jgi:hypothetical protein
MFRKKKNLLKEKLIEDQQTEEVYKFYDENKPQERIQIEAILNKNNSYKVLVIINDKNSTIDYLCMEIAEQMEKYSQFENLEGLKAINLTKKTEKGFLKLPITGEISEFISNGDAIYCDLITEEYWVKSTIKINSINTNLIINLDIKFRLESMIKKLRFLLMKLGINYWIDTVSELDDHYHYIFTSLNFKTLKAKNNIEYNLSDLKKGVSIEKSK